MTPNDREAFLEVVMGFAELKGKELSPPAFELYWGAMQHWPLEEFRAAAQMLLRSCTYMPMPKDFEDLRKAANPTVHEAWEKVLRAVRSGKFEEGGTVVDPFIDKVVRSIGGYESIAFGQREFTHLRKKGFEDAYSAQETAFEVREALPNLTSASPRLSMQLKALAQSKRLS